MFYRVSKSITNIDLQQGLIKEVEEMFFLVG